MLGPQAQICQPAGGRTRDPPSPRHSLFPGPHGHRAPHLPLAPWGFVASSLCPVERLCQHLWSGRGITPPSLPTTLLPSTLQSQGTVGSCLPWPSSSTSWPGPDPFSFLFLLGSPCGRLTLAFYPRDMCIPVCGVVPAWSLLPTLQLGVCSSFFKIQFALAPTGPGPPDCSGPTPGRATRCLLEFCDSFLLHPPTPTPWIYEPCGSRAWCEFIFAPSAPMWHLSYVKARNFEE